MKKYEFNNGVEVYEYIAPAEIECILSRNKGFIKPFYVQFDQIKKLVMMRSLPDSKSFFVLANGLGETMFSYYNISKYGPLEPHRVAFLNYYKAVRDDEFLESVNDKKLYVLRSGNHEILAKEIKGKSICLSPNSSNPYLTLTDGDGCEYIIILTHKTRNGKVGYSAYGDVYVNFDDAKRVVVNFFKYRVEEFEKHVKTYTDRLKQYRRELKEAMILKEK